VEPERALGRPEIGEHSKAKWFGESSKSRRDAKRAAKQNGEPQNQAKSSKQQARAKWSADHANHARAGGSITMLKNESVFVD